MIWLTWRQSRAIAWTALIALAALALILALTRPHLVHMYDTAVAACLAHGNCSQPAIGAFLSQDSFLQHFGGILLEVVPAVIGIFWGAPLIARELEAGTHRLAWNQSVTRTRWLASKLGLTGAAAMTAAGLLSLMVTWWASPIDRVAGNRFTPAVFDQRGIVPVGYAAFAFALGVTAGMLIRRAVPAMAATLAIFAAAQIAMPLWVRPHLIPPVRTGIALVTMLRSAPMAGMFENGPMIVNATIPGAWILSRQPTTVINPAGHVATGLSRTCAGRPNPTSSCIARLNLRVPVTYQPASRYWAFQWYETAIFLALAFTMAGLCFWWIRRRLS